MKIPGHVRQRKNGKWEFSLPLGVDGDGKKRRKTGNGFSTKKEAEEALLKLSQSKGLHLAKQTCDTLLCDYLSAWIDESEGDYSVSSIKHFRSYLKNHIKPAFDGKKLGQLSVDDLRSFYFALKNNDERPLSAQTIRHIHNMLSKALREATRSGKIPFNPVSLVKAPKLKFRLPNETWTVEQLDAFLRVASKSRWYAAFLIAIYTGARRGEVLALRWRDIDFVRGAVTISSAISSAEKGFEVGATKNKQSIRRIAIPFKLLDKLSFIRNQKHERDLRLFNEPSDFVTRTHEGNFVNPRNFDKEWKRLLKESKLPTIRLHDLRHTHATLLIQNEVNIKAVSARLGHSTTKVTLETYAHITPQIEEGIVKALNSMPMLLE